jgi:hypothetical protein
MHFYRRASYTFKFQFNPTQDYWYSKIPKQIKNNHFCEASPFEINKIFVPAENFIYFFTVSDAADRWKVSNGLDSWIKYCIMKYNLKGFEDKVWIA